MVDCNNYTWQWSFLYLAFIAVKSRFHGSPTHVAGVDKPILSLVVKLDQHGHGGERGSSQRWKFVVLLAGERQERVSAIHDVTVHQSIGVARFRRLTAVQSNDEEYLCIEESLRLIFSLRMFNPFTPRVKPWVNKGGSNFTSVDETLVRDHSN